MMLKFVFLYKKWIFFLIGLFFLLLLPMKEKNSCCVSWIVYKTILLILSVFKKFIKKSFPIRKGKNKYMYVYPFLCKK